MTALFAKGSENVFDLETDRIKAIIFDRNENFSTVFIQDEVELLKDYGNGIKAISIPQYLKLIPALTALVDHDIKLIELAGNETIQVTLEILNPTFNLEPLQSFCKIRFEIPSLTNPYIRRIVTSVRLREFSGFVTLVRSMDQITIKYIF